MKTENNFIETAKTFQENIAKSVKWTQNANSKLVETQMKTATDMFKKVLTTPQVDGASLTNEVKKQFETFNQQVADLAIVNQANLDTLLQQFETTAKSFTPINEQLKKEIENAVESSKETVQKIIDSSSSFTAPSAELTKETFEKLNDRIKIGIDANIKFWSDLMNPTSSAKPKTTETTETKVDSGLFKMSANSTGKKSATLI